MGDDPVKKHKMPYFRISVYLLIIVILTVMLIVISEITNLAGALFRYLQTIDTVHLDTALIVLLFLTFALALVIVYLWHELKRVMNNFNQVELSLNQSNTQLSFLNSILREDILNQLEKLNPEEFDVDAILDDCFEDLNQLAEFLSLVSEVKPENDDNLKARINLL